MLPTKTKVLTGLLVIALAPVIAAQAPEPAESGDDDDGPLDLSDFPGMIVDDVVVPVPSEIFSIMGKLGEETFEGEIVVRGSLASRDRSRLALAFGIAVADGFIAVQAQNKTGIEDAGRNVLKLSEALGLKSRVLKHTQKIIDASGRGDWGEVRKELDRTQKTVRDTMEEMRDGDLANCVSVGGWIRGTEAMTSLISKSYKPDEAELLNQPDLARHFSKLIAQMDEKVRGLAEVRAADTCLKRIAGLMDDGGKVIGKEAVIEIGTASGEFVDTVFGITAEGDGKS